MEARPRHEMVEPVAPLELLQHAGDVGDHRVERVRGVTSRPPNRSASDTTPTGSEVQATMWLARRGERWPRDVDQRDFRRAAADVEQHDAVGVVVDQRAAARDGEPRLGLAVDDLEIEPGLGLDAVEEFAAVFGRAAGLGGDQPRAQRRTGWRACRRRSSAPRRRGPSPAWPSRPLDDSPSPSRTMRENASMTRNWPGRVGTATSSRQLLVPRSSAAKTGMFAGRRPAGERRASGGGAGRASIAALPIAGDGAAPLRRLTASTAAAQTAAVGAPSRANTLRPRRRLRRFLPRGLLSGALRASCVGARNRARTRPLRRALAPALRPAGGRQTPRRRRRAASVGVLHLLFLHAPREPCRTLHALRSSLLRARLAAAASFTKGRNPRFPFPAKRARPARMADGMKMVCLRPDTAIRRRGNGSRTEASGGSSRRGMQWKKIFLAGRRMLSPSSFRCGCSSTSCAASRSPTSTTGLAAIPPHRLLLSALGARDRLCGDCRLRQHRARPYRQARCRCCSCRCARSPPMRCRTISAARCCRARSSATAPTRPRD